MRRSLEYSPVINMKIYFIIFYFVSLVGWFGFFSLLLAFSTIVVVLVLPVPVVLVLGNFQSFLNVVLILSY